MKNKERVVEVEQLRSKARELLLQAFAYLQSGEEHDKSVAGLVKGCIQLLEPNTMDFEVEMATDWDFPLPALTH